MKKGLMNTVVLLVFNSTPYIMVFKTSNLFFFMCLSHPGGKKCTTFNTKTIKKKNHVLCHCDR